jgi:hypothetical protein
MVKSGIDGVVVTGVLMLLAVLVAEVYPTVHSDWLVISIKGQTLQ